MSVCEACAAGRHTVLAQVPRSGDDLVERSVVGSRDAKPRATKVFASPPRTFVWFCNAPWALANLRELTTPVIPDQARRASSEM